MSDAAASLSKKEQQLLNANETVLLAGRDVTSVRFGNVFIASPLVILTSGRFIACKKKTFGSPTPDISVSWTHWSRIDSETQDGNMMSIVLTATTDRGAVQIIAPPVLAYDIETTARSQYLR